MTLPGQEVDVRGMFIDDVKTMGWEDYATFGRYYPAGWAKSDRLYCVKKAYDIQSEKFLVSYLGHEAQHFADYKSYPKLGQIDLEYRAKLTELILSRTTGYSGDVDPIPGILTPLIWFWLRDPEGLTILPFFS